MGTVRDSRHAPLRLSRGIVAGLVALTLLTSLAAPASAAPSSVGKRLKLTRQKMSSASSNLANAVAARKKTEIQLEVAIEDYNAANDAYQKADARLADLTVQLSGASRSLKRQQRLLNKRVVGIYRSGTVDVMAWVVRATDFNDFLTRLRMLATIAEADAQTVARVRAARDELDALLVRQRVLRARAKVLLAQRGAARDRVAARKADYDKIVAGLNAYFAKLEASEKRLEVAYAQEVARAKAAAEARKAAAARAAAVARIAALKRQRDSATGNQPGVSPPPPSAIRGGRADVVQFAMEQLGKPYEWGAQGPDTFDCSGLMVYCYAHFGISIPRVSRDQYSAGTHVSRDQLQPGDLVFFSYDGTAGGIHHVGMYVGDGKFIEAPHTGDVVKISELSNRDDFIGGTRI